MEERQGYDVLRIVVHSDRCYMSTDYVKGKQLILWLKYHSRIGKESLYAWIRELMESLEHFHQCRGNPSYQYVNPYSVIVGEDGKLYLLDLGSRDQEELLHLMQRRYIRENFLSPDNQYYQKPGIQEDVYGFGKTVQYLLSVAETEPPLGKLEEFRLRNMIRRCVDRNSKRCYQTIQEISEHFPKNRDKKSYRVPPARKGLVCAVALTGIAVIGTQAVGGAAWSQGREKGGKVSGDISDTENAESKVLEAYREELRQKEEQWDSQKQEIEQSWGERERELVYEMALLYFLELEEYGKGREILGSIGKPEEFAKDFAKLCAFMDGQMASLTERDVEQLLERMKGEVPDPKDDRYACCIAKGYERLEESRKEEQPEEGQGEEARGEEPQPAENPPQVEEGQPQPEEAQ